MTTTITETKKTTIALFREYKNKFISAWPCVLLSFFIYLHVLFLKIFPESTQAVAVWAAAIYQIIGAGCVLFEINGSLKILKGDGLIKSIKKYLSSWPKRTAQNTIIHVKTGGITCTASASAKIAIETGSETLEEKIEHLSKRVDDLGQKINKNRQEVMATINDNKKKHNKQIQAARKEIQGLKINLESTIVGDYKTAIFGVLMIIYGIIIPVIGLYV